MTRFQFLSFGIDPNLCCHLEVTDLPNIIVEKTLEILHENRQSVFRISMETVVSYLVQPRENLLFFFADRFECQKEFLVLFKELTLAMSIDRDNLRGALAAPKKSSNRSQEIEQVKSRKMNQTNE